VIQLSIDNIIIEPIPLFVKALHIVSDIHTFLPTIGITLIGGLKNVQKITVGSKIVVSDPDVGFLHTFYVTKKYIATQEGTKDPNTLNDIQLVGLSTVDITYPVQTIAWPGSVSTIYRAAADQFGIELGTIDDSSDVARVRYQVQQRLPTFLDSLVPYSLYKFQGMYGFIDLQERLQLRSRAVLAEDAEPILTFAPQFYSKITSNPENTNILYQLSLSGENTYRSSSLSILAATDHVTPAEKLVQPKNVTVTAPKSTLNMDSTAIVDVLRSPKEAIAFRLHALKELQDTESCATVIAPYVNQPINLGDIVEVRTDEVKFRGFVSYLDHFLLESTMLTKLYIVEL